MKPGFALTLSEDGIGLLHRSRGGWQRLGEVSLDDPGLGQTLRLMRSTAEGLADGPLRTKLVIPDSQILYTRLPVAGETEAEKRASLRRGLDGLTPYPVDEIVFDWQEAGDGTARLAVVARETLDEAESFADQHAFNPVCCVAAPPADKFEGEAFFGPTALAAGLLGRGERPERDSRPVRPGAMADYAAGDDGPRRASSAPKPPAPRKPRDEPPLRKPAAPPAAAPTVPDLPDDPAPAFASRRRGEGDAPQAEAPPQTEPGAPAAPSRLTLAAPTDEIPAPPAPAPKADAPDAPRLPVPPARPPAAPRPATGSGWPAFGVPSGRPATDASAPDPFADAPRKGPGLRLGLALTGALVLAMGAISLWSMLPDDDGIATAPPAAERPEPSAPGDEVAVLPDEPVAESPALQRPAMPPLAEDAPAPDTPPADPARPDLAAPPVLSETEAAEAYASTGLWQLDPKPLTAPPQDRIESLYIAELDPSIRPPRAVALPDPGAAVATDQPLPLQADPPDRDQSFVLDSRGLVKATPEGALTPDGVMVYAGPPPILPRGRAPEPEPDPEAPGSVEIAALQPEPEAEPDAVPDAPAAAATAQPEADTAAAPDSTAPDAPATALSDGVPVIEGRPALVPPPRPTLVVPVTLGRPPITPPARPDPAVVAPQPAPEAGTGTTPEAEAAPPPETAAPAETDAQAAPDPAPPEIVAAAAAEAAPDPEPVPEADPAPDLPETAVIVADAATATRLAPFRPRLRPAGITPVAMAPEPPAAIPTLRPRTRPEMPAATAAEAPPDPELDAGIEAALADALATEEADPAPPPGAALPEGAVRRSLRPAARPSDLGDRVASAPPDDTPAAAPAVPPAAAAPAPRVPTSASVAREATVENAINLGKVNLIGVYGTSGDRRALVRLPNGRYEKVKVGDRIDGGQVAAIGESELRYVKNGRNVVLDLPGG